MSSFQIVLSSGALGQSFPAVCHSILISVAHGARGQFALPLSTCALQMAFSVHHDGTTWEALGAWVLSGWGSAV